MYSGDILCGDRAVPSPAAGTDMMKEINKFQNVKNEPLSVSMKTK